MEPRRGGYVLGSHVLGYRVAEAVVCVRGGTPFEAQYRPNVVHSSPAQPEVVPGFRSQGDIVKARFMVQYDLLCPFPRALCGFPHSVHVERGAHIHRIEVPGIPDESRFVGLYPEREVYARSGWALVSATVDHGARLPFCTRDFISVSTHPSCEVGAWFGGSMGVASALLNWEPLKVPADIGPMNSLRRTPPMQPKNSSRWGWAVKIVSFQYCRAVCACLDTNSSPSQSGAYVRPVRC